jgi:hypothetical protein
MTREKWTEVISLEAAALGRSAKIRQKPCALRNKSKKNHSKISCYKLSKKHQAVEIQFVKCWLRASHDSKGRFYVKEVAFGGKLKETP